MFNGMQRKAALWITGAFKTTPVGGAEALAGLLPIPLLLRRLTDRSTWRVGTLASSHPLRGFLDERNSHAAPLHARSFARMSESERAKTSGAVMEIISRLPQLTEPIELLPDESRPGNRLTERFPHQVDVNETLPPPPTPPPDSGEWPSRADQLVHRLMTHGAPAIRRDALLPSRQNLQPYGSPCARLSPSQDASACMYSRIACLLSG